MANHIPLSPYPMPSQDLFWEKAEEDSVQLFGTYQQSFMTMFRLFIGEGCYTIIICEFHIVLLSRKRLSRNLVGDLVLPASLPAASYLLSGTSHLLLPTLYPLHPPTSTLYLL